MNKQTENKSDSYAVFENGGKQHIARIGARIKLDRLSGAEGENLVFDKVMMVSDNGKVSIGNPYISGQAVGVKILSHGKDDKIRIIKFKRRKHHLKRGTARRSYTEVEVSSISSIAKTTKTTKTSAKPAPKGETKASPAKSPEVKKAEVQPKKLQPKEKQGTSRPKQTGSSGGGRKAAADKK